MQFCKLRGEEAFPVTETRALERGAVFNDTATYYNYTMHLRKARFFRGTSATWLTPSVRHDAKGIGKCQDKSIRFPNFIRSRLLLRLTKSEAIQSDPPSHA